MTQPNHVPLRELAGEGEPWRQRSRDFGGGPVHQPRTLSLREGLLDPSGRLRRRRRGIGRIHTLHREVAPGVDVD